MKECADLPPLAALACLVLVFGYTIFGIHYFQEWRETRRHDPPSTAAAAEPVEVHLFPATVAPPRLGELPPSDSTAESPPAIEPKTAPLRAADDSHNAPNGKNRRDGVKHSKSPAAAVKLNASKVKTRNQNAAGRANEDSLTRREP
jgi:hypothetical protein